MHGERIRGRQHRNAASIFGLAEPVQAGARESGYRARRFNPMTELYEVWDSDRHYWVEAYIEAHVGRSLSLEELARLAELSLSHFAREFKVTTGKAPHEYVLLRRLDLARRLLRQTSDSLSDIALRCGFSDASHLVRAFRRRFGVTPGRWRSLTR